MDDFCLLFWQLEGTVCIHSNSCTSTIHSPNMQGGGGIKLWLLYSSCVAPIYRIGRDIPV